MVSLRCFLLDKRLGSQSRLTLHRHLKGVLVSTPRQSPESEASDAFRDRYLRMLKPPSIIVVEVVNMTNNTQFKTLLNIWLDHKKPMITPSTYASFTLIAENHLIPYFGKRKIGSITEPDIQSYISYLYESGRLDKS